MCDSSPPHTHTQTKKSEQRKKDGKNNKVKKINLYDHNAVYKQVKTGEFLRRVIPTAIFLKSAHPNPHVPVHVCVQSIIFLANSFDEIIAELLVYACMSISCQHHKIST